MRLPLLSSILAVCLLLAACMQPTKEEILRKAEPAETKQELEAALGYPDNIDKLGPVETWTYDASNGAVSFVLAGDIVTLRTTRRQEAR